jgi:hypothetical protein
MKKWITILAVVLVLFAGGYLALSFYAVKFIQAQIRKAVGPGVTIARIQVGATSLSMHGVRFEDPITRQKFLEMEGVKIYPDPRSFLKRSVHVRELVIFEPSFFFYRTQEGGFAGPWIPVKKQEINGEVGGKKEKKEREAVHIRIDCLRIRKGSVDFDDLKMGETPGQIRLREVDLGIKNIEYPLVSCRSPMELRGTVKGKRREGEIYAKGWIDLKTSDLELSLRGRDVEIRIFEPYYRKRVSAEIDSGHMNMDATITIKGEKIDIPGQLELSDFRIGEEGTVFYLPAKTLAPLLKDRGNRIKGRFHVRGDMDDPRFTLQEGFLTQVALSLAEALGIPVKRVGGPLPADPGKGP